VALQKLVLKLPEQEVLKAAHAFQELKITLPVTLQNLEFHALQVFELKELQLLLLFAKQELVNAAQFFVLLNLVQTLAQVEQFTAFQELQFFEFHVLQLFELNALQL
jgi:hypothetical protein